MSLWWWGHYNSCNTNWALYSNNVSWEPVKPKKATHKQIVYMQIIIQWDLPLPCCASDRLIQEGEGWVDSHREDKLFFLPLSPDNGLSFRVSGLFITDFWSLKFFSWVSPLLKWMMNFYILKDSRLEHQKKLTLRMLQSRWTFALKFRVITPGKRQQKCVHLTCTRA